MTRLETLIIRSVDELRAVAAPWDGLWQRSEVASPLARAEMIAQWLEHFASDGELAAVIVADGSRFVAALPLVKRVCAKVFPVGAMPTNPWSICGDLLIDSGELVEETLGQLLDNVDRLGWPLLCLSATAYDAPRWQALTKAAHVRGWLSAAHEEFRFGCISIEGDWSSYEASWSGNHRRHLQKALRRAEREGGVELRTIVNPSASELESLLRVGFEVEDRSWKGAAGSSVLRSPGKFEFYLQQAQQMSCWGHLHLTLLEHLGRPIAFEYGYVSKGTYFSPKVGYDEAFARLTPGQLLRRALLRKFHEESPVNQLDFWGPITAATAKWITHDYPRGRLILAPPRVLSRTIFHGLETARSAVRTLRRWRLGSAVPKPAAAPEAALATDESIAGVE